MATIEPRLIHLLNESTTPQLPHSDLPPLHSLPLHRSSERPLPPLEPDASHRGDRASTDAQTLSNPVDPLNLAVDDVSLDHRTLAAAVSRADGKHAGSSASFPLRLLLGDTEAAESSHSLNKILDDSPDALDDASKKKRHRGLHAKDDFVQLPQPLKKQKAAQTAPVMPPIINGLHEPPPHAALFPPISSDGKDGTQMKLLHELNQTSPEADKNYNKARKRATKPRRKWSEEETNHLLLGVNRHGVGKWTSILEDADFKFNDRTAGDLKDRFRTCCPDELRRSKKGSLGSPSGTPPEPKQKTKGDTHLDKILIDREVSSTTESPAGNDADANPKQKKSRAHRKKMEDLVELGIHGPFKKSHRRERRPFTEQDDTEILEGLNQHGPAWTKIQRDPRFHLASRQPTDLRDRVRNKYPSIYHRIEKGTFQVNDAGRGSDIMEPSINMSINNSFQTSNAPLEPQMSSVAPREDLPRWPLQRVDTLDGLHSNQAFEFGESVTPQFMGGEMDISRLLLDDAQISQSVSRMGVESMIGCSSSFTITPESRRGGLEKTTERAQHAAK
ncbi:hypothetical protein AK830_g6095 [Neonectria ditissima]|uniref:Myb-like domain-containing protein n=1 Tax=Neonectria ditissima TaxID=78410 RepID=A0A0N8H710_9HYPO|nr:hypothetical protein AK830_g6095 [Neonectria ditissima]